MTPLKAIRAKCLECCCNSLTRFVYVPSKNARSIRIGSARTQTERESKAITLRFLLKSPTQRRIWAKNLPGSIQVSPPTQTVLNP